MTNNRLRKRWLVLLCLFLVSCSEREGLAPVVELNWRAVNSNAKAHYVAKGETLYAIAFRYDQDYRQLARANNLSSPYTLRVGQMIRLKPVGRPAPAAFYTKPSYVKTRPARHPAPKPALNKYNYPDKGWQWPIHGKIMAVYAPQQGKKGIDIAGRKGEKIHAASSGIVAYAGNGLAGYGNLIIIKHNNQFLTAYGNNLKNLVREGQYIRAGQPIAEIGVVDRRYWGLHFEIRQAGKPVNPMNYLQNG